MCVYVVLKSNWHTCYYYRRHSLGCKKIRHTLDLIWRELFEKMLKYPRTSSSNSSGFFEDDDQLQLYRTPPQSPAAAASSPLRSSSNVMMSTTTAAANLPHCLHRHIIRMFSSEQWVPSTTLFKEFILKRKIKEEKSALLYR